jgi:hypothetical protein
MQVLSLFLAQELQLLLLAERSWKFWLLHRKIESWRLAIGGWQLATCSLQLATCGWQLAIFK